MRTSTGIGERIEAIDGLRALAVSLVLAHHLWRAGVPGGFIGVDIFFVISGFVITGALLRQNLDLRQFYVHRVFRIIPAMIPVIVFALLCNALGVPLAEPRDALLAIASIINWGPALEITSGRFLSHFWSLSVEEQFYLVWPLLLGIALRLRVPVIAVLVGIVAAGLIWQNVLHSGGASFYRIYYGTDTRISQLMIGCLLYFLVDRVRVPGWLGAAALALLLVLAFTVERDSAFYLSEGIGLIGAVSAVLVGALAQGRHTWQAPLLTAPAQWAGSRSYAIYLWHFPMLGLIKAYSPGFVLGAVLVTGLTLLMAEASMRLIERPARALRPRFERSVAPASVQS